MDPAISSSDEHTNQSSAEQNVPSPIECLIIENLDYLGCNRLSILRVLQLYDLGGTPYDVARYIREEQLPQYNEHGTRPDGRIIFIQSKGDDSISVEFAQGIPVLGEIRTADTPDGRRILGIVIEGLLLRSAAGDEVIVSIHRAQGLELRIRMRERM